MNSSETAPTRAVPKRPAAAVSGQPSGLSVVAVYQDVSSRKRVTQLCQRVTRCIGRQPFQLRMWSFRKLNESNILRETISAATAAEVLIVSLRAAEKLHPRFCSWVDGWRSRRRQPDGTLIALIDVSGWNNASSERVRNYLRDAAWEARLEFLPREYAASSRDNSLETEQIR